MNVFITGGTGGIGYGLVHHYLAVGAKVGICGGSVEQFESICPKPNDHLSFYDLDVTNKNSVETVFSDFSQKCGGIDLLICCAGINNNSSKHKLKINFELEAKILEVNLMGTFYCFESAIKIMIKDRKPGQIVALSSAAGFVGLPGAPAYCASKSALITLCESLNIRLESDRISVTAIAPGYINTPLARSTNPGIEHISSTLKVDQAVQEITRAINKRKIIYVFPFSIKIQTIILKNIPRQLFRYIVSKVYKKLIKAQS